MDNRRLGEFLKRAAPPAMDGEALRALPPQKAARTCAASGSVASESTRAESVSAYSDSPSCDEESATIPDCGLEQFVEEARRVYTDAWIAHSLEKDSGNARRPKREDRADAFSERRAADRYEELRGTFTQLLPFLGPATPATPSATYDVVECQGGRAPGRLRKLTGREDEAEWLQKQLQFLRREPSFRAWEAACAVMAGLATRKEKCWLEAHTTYEILETRLEKTPLCRSSGSRRRKEAIRQFLREKTSGGCGLGFFSNYLVLPTASLRVALARDPDGSSTPAAFVVTARMPLWEALASMDDKGPLRGAASRREWCRKAGRQVAFQPANLGKDEESRAARAPAATLTPDGRLRDLLRSRRPVVLLEVVASLAPRDEAKRRGFSEIVTAELARVTREAKKRGEAVVFCLGSDSPHKLAEKVYLRPPIGDHGLRCGYLRWRDSAGQPWAREMSWDDRITLCLQMP